MTLGQYYASFRSTSGLLAALIGTAPLTSGLFASDAAGHIFPPLGDVDQIARFGMVTIAIAMTYAIYFCREWPARVVKFAIGACLAGAMAFVFLYCVSWFAFVRRLDVPTQRSSIYVSVGYQRTPTASSVFPYDSDYEMLRARGTDDEQIRLLWTPDSVLVARLALFGSCAGWILCLVSMFCLGILAQVRKN